MRKNKKIFDTRTSALEKAAHDNNVSTGDLNLGSTTLDTEAYFAMHEKSKRDSEEMGIPRDPRLDKLVEDQIDDDNISIPISPDPSTPDPSLADSNAPTPTKPAFALSPQQIKERDEDLANDKMSEPFDFYDPDG